MFCAEQEYTVPFLSPLEGFWVRTFEQAPTGYASILLEADNRASAIVGNLLHGNTVSVARIQNV